jgi:hypothetical protein
VLLKRWTAKLATLLATFTSVLILVLSFSSPSKTHLAAVFMQPIAFHHAAIDDLTLGTNLSGISPWSTQLPFLDAFKTSVPWLTQCAGEELGCSGSWASDEYAQLDLDEQGWVKSLPTASDPPEYTRVGTLLFREINGRYPGGQYVVLYDGEGAIEYRFDAQKDETLSSPGRDIIQVTPSNAGIYLLITATDPNRTGNYIRNIHVVPAQHELTFQAEIFNPKFIDRIHKFRALRFMDWMNTNNSQQREAVDRPQVENASYGFGKGVPNAASGNR